MSEKDEQSNLEKTQYENRIDDLIERFKNKLLSDAIRLLVSELKTDKESAQAFFDHPGLILEHISLKDGIAYISAGKLIAILKQQILLREDPHERDKAEVLFKYLSSRYSGTGQLSISQIEERILTIRDGGSFPMPDNSGKRTGKDDGKYRALRDLFLSKSEASNHYTIQFGIALLGIKLNQLEKILPELEKALAKKEKPQPTSLTSQVVPKSLETPGRKPVVLALVTILVICATYFLVKVFTEERPSSGAIPKVKKIASHEVFQAKDYLEERLIAKDCVTVEPYLFTYKDILIDVDTIPLDSLWIKFRVTNYSDQAYFPDVIYLKKVSSGTLRGQMVRTEMSIVNTTKLTFEIKDISANDSWDILSSDLFPAIEAKSQVFGSALVVSDKNSSPRIHEFKLVLGFSGGTLLPVESENSFKVGFSN